MCRGGYLGANMTTRILAVMAVLLVLYGCGQSSPAPEQGDEGGSQKSRRKRKFLSQRTCRTTT